MKTTQQHPKAATDYRVFLERKTHLGNQSGFAPLFMPDFLFPFQRALTTWAIEKGRADSFQYSTHENKRWHGLVLMNTSPC